nr:DUF5906 domain-containing protein [uncultured Draconibacterium sp.]
MTEPKKKTAKKADKPKAKTPAKTTEKREYGEYFKTRIFGELGLTESQNRIKLKIEDLEKGTDRLVEHEIFGEDEHGNITITPFDLDGYLINYNSKDPENFRYKSNNRKIHKLIRYKEPKSYEDKKTGETRFKKYDFPKGAKTQPFLTPGILEKWRKKQKIVTLVLIEGYFKATAGDVNGLDIIGLSSISHHTDKENGMMYADVLRVIKDCLVENVIILYDGDARNISTKDLEAARDLRRRPYGFIASALKVRELLKDAGVDVYYAEIDSRELEKGHPKGLDDLYEAYRDEANEITKDLLSLSRRSSFFHRLSIRFDPSKLYKHFEMSNVGTFYNFHSEAIHNRKFIYSGTTYQYNEKSGECEVKVPGRAKDYFRVATDYYRWVSIPNKYKQRERSFIKWTKTTITDDHKEKGFINFIPKYNTFCNVPDHTNFQQAVDNCFNVYAPFDHEESEEGTCEVTLGFIKHIFQEHYELGLDYVQLLYQRPTQILPILCLVSKENKTGKSTFIKWLKAIFKQNCTIIGNAELNSEFNAGWSTKLIVGCEETLVDKKPTIEKIKALSTADRVNMNRKGKDHEEIEFFAKFILASNKENNFIYATKSDIRYWVRKVPVIAGEERVNLLEEMIEEIPAFLYFLNRRKMSTENKTRMWFKEDLLRTEALEKLVRNSRTGIEKELYEFLKDIYFDFGEKEVLLTPKDILEKVLKRKTDTSYIRDIIRTDMKAEKYMEGKVKTYKIPYWGTTIGLEGDEVSARKEYTQTGRPYLFLVEKVLDKIDYESWKSIHGTPQTETEPEPEPEPAPQPKQKTIDEGIAGAEAERRQKLKQKLKNDPDAPF